ncbi:uncharacterized protein ACLA_031390 [Aspergillus clavatus NRRL 1]|uniref:DUF7729 domain-containing protein n=1 Tax=Aspergillus clavatus (strain ATCC 1007 / CBS 513.65 / DSM 816 / NCTC 3887 / NRRL 1 / QM 1276 / 107) TaxID=344612 RepID=A1CRY5_ASPCL|nr:uncharacterized protein ACLA_031390 [Aspergillus clavatus NRRL 1]EAW08406.1 conserved hypothetical protein [Aspergillus clavatus NRRL 1]
MKLFIQSNLPGWGRIQCLQRSTTVNRRCRQPAKAIPTARYVILIALLMALIMSPLVSAFVIPDVAPPPTYGMLLPRTDAIRAPEIAAADRLDASYSDTLPFNGRAQEERFRYDRSWVLENKPSDETSKRPILVAPDEDNGDASNALSLPLVARSGTTSNDSLPTAFDTNLSTNFTTQSCPKFFNEFLSDSTVTKCHAISLLLHDSTSFFHTLTSAAATSHVLDLACAASVDQCKDTMARLATRLTTDDACGKDYKLGNPLVTDAYTAMVTYEPVYRATCLKNPTTKDYCFVDAATNTSSPQNLDAYSLPAGFALGSPYPTCNPCLQASMDIFSRWAQVDGQPLNRAYLPAAQTLNRRCGTNFANVNITVGSQNSAASVIGWAPADARFLGSVLAVSFAASLLGLF